MKKLLVITLCLLTLIAPVYAEEVLTGENGNTNKNGEVIKEVRALKVTIKANILELHQLRLELKTKLQEKRTIINQYKEQEELTEEQRLEVKNMIQEFKEIRATLTDIRNNAMKNLKEYKSDKSENRLTGLRLVVAAQEERMELLQECIDKLQ